LKKAGSHMEGKANEIEEEKKKDKMNKVLENIDNSS